jgi:hypothetical protein
MRTFHEIHAEIDSLSEHRTELWNRLSHGYDPELRQELKDLDLHLDSLWHEQRALKAQLRFGDREHIVARARAEERLERSAA